MESENRVAWLVGSLAVLPALASRGQLGDGPAVPVALTYALALTAGALGGALFKVGRRLRVVFAGCGAIAGLGSAFAVRALLERYASVPTLLLALVASFGATPGVVIGWLFAVNRR